MPTYVYICAKCKLEIEELRPISMADSPMECLVCGAQIRRRLTATMFIGAGKSTEADSSSAPGKSCQIRLWAGSCSSTCTGADTCSCVAKMPKTYSLPSGTKKRIRRLMPSPCCSPAAKACGTLVMATPDVRDCPCRQSSRGWRLFFQILSGGKMLAFFW